MQETFLCSLCFGCGANAVEENGEDVVFHFSKVHMDQLVDPSELEVCSLHVSPTCSSSAHHRRLTSFCHSWCVAQSIEGSQSSLTRMRSISSLESICNPASLQNLQQMPSVGGLSIFRNKPDVEMDGAHSQLRVLSRLDTSSRGFKAHGDRQVSTVSEGEAVEESGVKAFDDDDEGVDGSSSVERRR